MDLTNFRERFVYWGLLISLILSFSVTPLFDESIRPLNIFILSTLGFSVWAISITRKRLLLGMALAIPIIVFSIISISSDNIIYITAFYLLAVLFFTYIISAFLIDIFSHTRVDTNRLLSAICVYLCMGIIWAMLYGLIDIHDPAAIKIPAGDTTFSRINELMYFSFVTLTTLGYGDVIPLSNPARSLAAVEALVGQLYLTVLVARLVGLHIAVQSPDSIQHHHAAQADGREPTPPG